MQLYHYAILLQILGFILAVICGSILFNRDIAGNFAHRLDTRITKVSTKLRRRFDNRKNPLYVLTHVVSTDVKVPKSMTFQLFSPFISLIFISIGLIWNLSWILWFGIILASIKVVTEVIADVRIARKAKSWLLLPISFISGNALKFVIVPLLILVIIIIRVIKFVFDKLMINDNFKKILILIGSTMIIICPTMEAIIMW